MARRRFRGTASVENQQTGDGRVFAPNAFAWEVPGPLAWMRDGDQHVDLSEVAPQIGVIETMTRTGDLVEFDGFIDDEIVDGAEMVRRLEAGSASHGSRQGVSVDPDDWAYQVVLMEQDDDDGMVVMASAEGRGGAIAATRPLPASVRLQQRVLLPAGVRAAAGDPDPGEDGGEGGVVMWEDAADAVLMRFTRARIRGATLCAVPAFSNAFLELDGAAPAEGEGEGDDTDEGTEGEGDEGESTTASATTRAPLVGSDRRRAAAVAPPRAYFELPEPDVDARGMVDVYGMPVEELIVEQPDGSLGVPQVITADGLVFGHVALWGQCHIGYPDGCVSPPESATGYAHFHVGEVVTDTGDRIATGPLTVGCDHAAARLLAPEARDHYAHSGLTYADVRAVNGAMGIWVSGRLRSITDEQLSAVQASSLSGDWRRIGAGLEMIGALAVSVPGFPITRDALAASAFDMIPPALTAAAMGVVDDVQMSLVAAGIVHRCGECAARARARGAQATADGPVLSRLDDVDAKLSTLLHRTTHLRSGARDDLLASIRR